MMETQATISRWGDVRVAARANEEMSELLRLLTSDGYAPVTVVEECADIVIVLFRLADRMGQDLLKEVDRKMAVNRKRTWKPDGTGHGYHVREKSVA